jgi:membrane protein implicated in regulation of membrane protease activity
MSFFMKLAAYAFLAIMGFSALSAGVEGWRYYFAILLFIFCTLRILMMLRQRMAHGTKPGDTDTPPPQTPDQSPPGQ